MQMTSIKALINQRDLLTAWTMRIIRARYQQSILGGLWAVMQPAAMVVIFTTVFSYFIRVDTSGVPYVVFSYTALVPWLLFSASLSDMVESIVGNMNLVAKIYFPREIVVIAAMLARLLDFLIAFSVLIILMLFYRIPIFTASWLLLPGVILVQLALTLGLGLIGAGLNVFYRDIRHLVTLGLQLWLYATPIIYPVSMVPERFRSLYFLNPMAGAIEAYRAILIHQSYPDSTLGLSAVSAVIILVIGYWFFKRVEYKFADVI
jgi:lipopolysaccharide transport system permease protein